MADKHFVRTSISRLQRQVESLQSSRPTAAGDDTWTAKRDVLYAETEHLLGISLPSNSPLFGLFKKWSGTALNGDPVSTPEATHKGDPLTVIAEILTAAEKWNESRTEEEATPALAEDIHRILGRNLLRYPPVQISLAALVAAATFAIFGAIRFQDKEFNIQDKINEAEKKVNATSSAASKLDNEITSARQRVSDLAVSAIKDLTAERIVVVREAASSAVAAIDGLKKQSIEEIKGTVKLEDITTKKESALGELRKAEVSATTDIGEAKKRAVDEINNPVRMNEIANAQQGALKSIQNATDLNRLENALKNAEHSIESSAKQYVEEVKAKVAPSFSDAIKEDANKIQKLEQRLEKADNRIAIVDAAFRAMGTPDNKIIETLADYFNQTVVTVYVVLGLSFLSFIVNIGIFISLIRRKP